MGSIPNKLTFFYQFFGPALCIPLRSVPFLLGMANLHAKALTA
jgi:hypothetical protein